MATQTYDFTLDSFSVCLDMNDDVFDFLAIRTGEGKQKQRKRKNLINQFKFVLVLGESRLYPTAYSKAKVFLDF